MELTKKVIAEVCKTGNAYDFAQLWGNESFRKMAIEGNDIINVSDSELTDHEKNCLCKRLDTCGNYIIVTDDAFYTMHHNGTNGAAGNNISAMMECAYFMQNVKEVYDRVTGKDTKITCLDTLFDHCDDVYNWFIKVSR